MKFKIVRRHHNNRNYKYELYYDYDDYILNNIEPISILFANIDIQQSAIEHLKSKAQDLVSDHIVEEFEL